jgi:hypothetical protein
MQKNRTTLAVLLVIATCAPVKSSLKTGSTPSRHAPDDSQAAIHLCDVLRQPEKYDGKQVTVRATYRSWFENSQLYCLACLDRGSLWLRALATDGEAVPGVRKLLKLARKGQMGVTINGTFTGTFHGPGRYGHLGISDYEIEVEEARELKLVQRTGVVPERLPEDVKKKVCH